MPYIKMHHMNNILFIIGLLGVFAPVQSAFGWGSVGHRTTGYVAEKHLLPSVRTQIKEWLGSQDLGDVANWADTLKKDASWAHSSWYHFEKIEDGQTFLQSLKTMPNDQLEKGGTVSAILRAEQVFLNSRSTKLEKANALKFIVHFVGDIHQPLHTGRPADNGGNKVNVVWDGEDTNLHAIWDVHVIQYGHHDLFAEADEDYWPEEQYAHQLIQRFGREAVDKAALQDPDSWVRESMALRAAAYRYVNESEAAYTRRFLDTIDRRVYLAGVRIAGMINSMVMQTNPTATRLSLRSAIEKVVGVLSNYISLKPKATASPQLTTQILD